MKNLLHYMPLAVYGLVFMAIAVYFLRLVRSKVLRIATVLLSGILAFTLLSIARSRAPLNVSLSIESPQQGVTFHSPPVLVKGTVSPENARVRLLVHPEDTDHWWVQSPPELNKATGDWQGVCYIGTDSMGIGRRYDIVAVGSASPWFLDALLGRVFSPGTTVKTLPRISKSEIVVVTRGY